MKLEPYFRHPEKKMERGALAPHPHFGRSYDRIFKRYF
jgi:hypothetical protein